MSTNIVLPDLGESVVEATVAKWLKKEGDRVSVGEPLVELETEKIDLEVGASQAGVLTRIAQPDAGAARLDPLVCEQRADHGSVPGDQHHHDVDLAGQQLLAGCLRRQRQQLDLVEVYAVALEQFEREGASSAPFGSNRHLVAAQTM